jgi:hypothetical protein
MDRLAAHPKHPVRLRHRGLSGMLQHPDTTMDDDLRRGHGSGLLWLFGRNHRVHCHPLRVVDVQPRLVEPKFETGGDVEHQSPGVDEEGHRAQRLDRIRDRTRQAHPALRGALSHGQANPLVLDTEGARGPAQRHQAPLATRIPGPFPGAFARRGHETRIRVAPDHRAHRSHRQPPEPNNRKHRRSWAGVNRNPIRAVRNNTPTPNRIPMTLKQANDANYGTSPNADRPVPAGPQRRAR